MKFLLPLLFLSPIVFSNFAYAEEAGSEEEIQTGESSEIEEVLESVKNSSPIKEEKEPRSTDLKKSGTAKLIALNKITAKSEELVIKTGELKYFYNMGIKVHKCLKDGDPYKPRDYVLVTVTESRRSEDDKVIFQGWLNSADISVSNIPHPVYELFLQTCP